MTKPKKNKIKKMSFVKFKHLDDEVITSVKYIKYGLNEIKDLTGMPDSNHIAFYLLSNGFERLMKCIICFWEYETNNEFPNVKRKYGHNLIKLKKEIVNICNSMNYREKCIACNDDVDFLEKDELLFDVLNVLSKFGYESRYYNFDMLVKEEITYDDPNDLVSEIENKIISLNPKLKAIQSDIDKTKEFDDGLNTKLLELFQRFARTLGRLFALGDLGEEAKSMYADISQFL